MTLSQTTLFDNPPAPPHNGTPTSIAAAESIVPHVNRQQELILAYLRTCDGDTREIPVCSSMPSGNAVRPRVRELIGKGLVQETDTQRQTRSGRAAAVLRVT
jgi:hypothetical protein